MSSHILRRPGRPFATSRCCAPPRRCACEGRDGWRCRSPASPGVRAEFLYVGVWPGPALTDGHLAYDCGRSSPRRRRHEHLELAAEAEEKVRLDGAETNDEGSLEEQAVQPHPRAARGCAHVDEPVCCVGVAAAPVEERGDVGAELLGDFLLSARPVDAVAMRASMRFRNACAPPGERSRELERRSD
jgi:hypothetical protein